MSEPPKLIILDRDGVINHDSNAYIKSLNEWEPYVESIHAIARLSKAGWMVAVATNQSGIARGYYSEHTLAEMNRELHRQVNQAGGKIDCIAYCPHGPDDDCDCRKPLPGLLYRIQSALKLETIAGCWMVGDSLRDLEAGAAVGSRLALVRTGKGSRTELHGVGLERTLIFDDLAAFTDWLLREERCRPC
ncbi:D-glycero-beta-D-manno-heptose 1,7-bisphosphate 7-phosphatase [Aidingimonas lacisalsi]|uniref:D-glycero-beta-D-manno-heptose 1,7-bisphosphate 7-phosphatase n=1 Tax=Aidingimonas lacisalsi TaxID=2604086 RepID=UPI0011D1F295|nr:D-glycero-beta-D-manno-heptose 1,7-bisphosphate 7-phosphatase [Aidingimonas lacisalsi]